MNPNFPCNHGLHATRGGSALLLAVALAYVVYRRPALTQPLTVALAATGVLAAIVTAIVTAAAVTAR